MPQLQFQFARAGPATDSAGLFITGHNVAVMGTAATGSTTVVAPHVKTSGYRSLDEGQRVEFEVNQGQKGPQADKVRSI